MKTQWILLHRSTTTIKSRTLEPVWNETLTDKHRYAPWLNMLLEMSIIDLFEELNSILSFIYVLTYDYSVISIWSSVGHSENFQKNHTFFQHPSVLSWQEAGDSLSIKIWDYDKAANNDLLAEGILDGSHFHKPGDGNGHGHVVMWLCPQFLGLERFFGKLWRKQMGAYHRTIVYILP